MNIKIALDPYHNISKEAALRSLHAAGVAAPTEQQAHEARCAVSGGSLPVSSVDALFVRWNCKACNALERAQRAYNTGDRLERTREEAAAAAFQLAAKELRAEMERVNMRQPEENQ
jgi:hypothetical protein